MRARLFFFFFFFVVSERRRRRRFACFSLPIRLSVCLSACLFDFIAACAISERVRGTALNSKIIAKESSRYVIEKIVSALRAIRTGGRKLTSNAITSLR